VYDCAPQCALPADYFDVSITPFDPEFERQMELAEEGMKAYTTGIVRNHPFVDGKKRTAFMAAYVFLGSNGLRLVASEVEAVQFVTLLAASEIEESEFAAWLRANCQ